MLKSQSGWENSARSTPQRRQLTVLFVDLVDSTSLLQANDIEDLHLVLEAFLTTATKIVEEENGIVARYMGDGLLAYFGFPEAVEGLAGRSVNASLRMRDAIEDLKSSSGYDLEVRIGVATGDVIVGKRLGKGPAAEIPITGTVPNLAARLQAKADPGRIFTCQLTERLSRDRFHFRSLGRIKLKGFAQKQSVCEVTRRRNKPKIFESKQIGLMPFTGRDSELKTLIDQGKFASQGQRRSIQLKGDAGIGKSRLLREFRQKSDDGSAIWLDAFCSPYHSSSPLFVAKQLLPSTSNRVTVTPDQHGQSNESEISYIDIYAKKYFDLLCDHTDGKSAVFVIEDMHWADDDSIALFELLAKHGERKPWFFIYSTREDLPLSDIDTYCHLGPLSKSNNKDLVAKSAADNISDQSRELITRLSGGVPLYVKELCSLIHLDQAVNARSHVPATLSDLLLAKLDEASAALSVLQIAAICENQLDIHLLSEIAEEPMSEIGAKVDQLVKVGIFEPSATDRSSWISFSHNLYREAALKTLLKQHRIDLHRRAATILESKPREALNSSQLIRHWLESGAQDKAIELLLQNGETELKNGLLLEAGTTLRQALKLVRQQKAGTLRDSQELNAQKLLANVFQKKFGYSAQETSTAVQRAEQLAGHLGSFNQQFEQLTGRWMIASSGGNFSLAANLSKRVLALAMSEGSELSLAVGWMTRITALCRVADLVGAEQAFENGEKYFHCQKFKDQPGSIAQTYGNAAIVSLLLGDVPTARTRAATALKSGRSMARSYDQAFARYMIAMVTVMQGDNEIGARLARSALKVAESEKFPQFEATSQIVLGKAMASLGEEKAGLESIQKGLKGMQIASSKVGQTMYLTWMAEAERYCGFVEDADRTLSTALAVNKEERFYRPETLRLKSLVQKELGHTQSAQKYFSQAHKLALAMKSRWYESRLPPAGA